MTLEHESDSKDKGEVNDQDCTINQLQPNRLHPVWILSVKSRIVSPNLGRLVDEKRIKLRLPKLFRPLMRPMPRQKRHRLRTWQDRVEGQTKITLLESRADEN
jgi:hypothetical protein